MKRVQVPMQELEQRLLPAAAPASPSHHPRAPAPSAASPLGHHTCPCGSAAQPAQAEVHSMSGCRFQSVQDRAAVSRNILEFSDCSSDYRYSSGIVAMTPCGSPVVRRFMHACTWHTLNLRCLPFSKTAHMHARAGMLIYMIRPWNAPSFRDEIMVISLAPQSQTSIYSLHWSCIHVQCIDDHAQAVGPTFFKRKAPGSFSDMIFTISESTALCSCFKCSRVQLSMLSALWHASQPLIHANSMLAA